jgi:hypothetical protein
MEELPPQVLQQGTTVAKRNPQILLAVMETTPKRIPQHATDFGAKASHDIAGSMNALQGPSHLGRRGAGLCRAPRCLAPRGVSLGLIEHATTAAIPAA